MQVTKGRRHRFRKFSFKTMFFSWHLPLGRGGVTKTDEFLEKIKMAFDPPPMLWGEDNFFFGRIWKFRFTYTWGIYLSFWIFRPTFDELKSRLWVQSSQKASLKYRKNEKMPQNNQILGMFLCIRVTKSVSPEFCHSCKVKFFSFFVYEDGWESGFCVKNAAFWPNHKLVWGKMCLYNIRHEMDQNCIRIL